MMWKASDIAICERAANRSSIIEPIKSSAFDRITGLDPCARSAEHVEKICKAQSLEDARRRARTKAARADDRRPAIRIELGRALVNSRKWSVDRRRHMPVVIFARLAHVDHLHVALRTQQLAQIIDRNLRDHAHAEAVATPSFHSARQITFDVFDPHSRQPYHRFINFRFVFGDDYDGRVEFDQLPGPRIERPAEADVERSGYMPGPEIGVRPHVQNRRATTS